MPRIVKSFLGIAVLVLALPSQAAAQEMMTYQMVLFRTGPNKDIPADKAKVLADGHLAGLAKLNAERVNVLYGPFLDEGDIRGLAILDVPDAATAKAKLADDPFVKAGHMVLDVKPWMGPRGWFSPPAQPQAFDRLVFGFLMRAGPTSHTPAEVQAIQKGHLAYMDDLHTQGKLVAAGPFGDSSDYRGIVIYRVATVDEARALAAGDPAVKAGRLRIEARPWMTFKGILKEPQDADQKKQVMTVLADGARRQRREGGPGAFSDQPRRPDPGERDRHQAAARHGGGRRSPVNWTRAARRRRRRTEDQPGGRGPARLGPRHSAATRASARGRRRSGFQSLRRQCRRLCPPCAPHGWRDA